MASPVLRACCQKKSLKFFETRPSQPRNFENFGGGYVGCLKITEDKSSDNRVHVSDARLIKATRPKAKHWARRPRLNTIAMLRRRAQSSRLSTTSALRHNTWSPRQILKPASQMRSSRRASNTSSMRKHRVRGSCFNTTATPKTWS